MDASYEAVVDRLKNRILDFRQKTGNQRRLPRDLKADITSTSRKFGMEKLAKDLGIGKSTIGKWCRDNKPPKTTPTHRQNPGFRKIAVEDDVLVPKPARTFTIVGPRGIRVEGLSLADLAGLFAAVEASHA